MCFGSKDSSNAPATKPAQLPPQSPATSSYPTKPPTNSNMNSDFAPPSGPPPSHSQKKSHLDEYAPPPGPPPAQSHAPPTRLPASSSQSGAEPGDYAPPPGPPPARDYAPPPGPPPAHEQHPASQKQAWEEAVPDTSLLPPPPDYFGSFDRSPTNNATEEDAEAGERWCRNYPLFAPLQLESNVNVLGSINSGNIRMITPPAFRGALAQTGLGVWKGHTYARSLDTCIASYPPLYSVQAHSPIATKQTKTIYFEVNLLKQGSRREVSLALGFSAPPYPAFRLPGWHRGSLAIHGDDGRKYINDRWGGKSFTDRFRPGETVGVGIDLIPGQGGGIVIEVFFTRDGRETGRWNLAEETDRTRDLPVTGLEGFHDLCAAVGVFDQVAFEIVFVPSRWKWKGHRG